MSCLDHDTNQRCSDCDTAQLARNHFFTGKLLVERDFTDEQRFFLGKDRRHLRDLHGHGTICGLKVDEHPEPSCRGKYVVVRAGVAADCCGREIIVPRDERFDFFSLVQKVIPPPPPPPDWSTGVRLAIPRHKLQICLRYRECPAEDVPSLFDECGGNDGGCQPNRIVESYELDVIVDPPPPKTRQLGGVALAWQHTIPIALTQKVVVDKAGKRLWVMAANGNLPQTNIHVYDAENHAALAIRTFDQMFDFAVSTDGSRVYVAQGTKLNVFDAANFGSEVPLSSRDLPNLTESVRLAPAPDGRVFALASVGDPIVQSSGTASTDRVIPTRPSRLFVVPAEPKDDLSFVEIPGKPRDLSVSPDGKWAFVAADGPDAIYVIDTATLTKQPLESPEGAHLASSTTTADTRLAVAGANSVTLYSIKPGADPLPLGDPYRFEGGAPGGLTFSMGGRWLYLTTNDPGKAGRVQAIDAYAIEIKNPEPPVTIDVGSGPIAVEIRDDGLELYVPIASPTSIGGGVAIIGVTEQDCGSIFDGIIEPCPACGSDDCVVLATIHDYVFGSSVGEAQIDNLTDRPLLPSTSVIADAVRCVMERPPGSGAPGPQGPPGAQGLQGSAGTNGTNGTNGKDGINGKDGVNGTDGKDGKEGIKGKDGVNGTDGKDGKEGIKGKDGINGKDGKDGKEGIKGKDGINGKDGKDGTNGKDGINGTNGTNGVDGKDAPPLDLPHVVHISWPHGGVIGTRGMPPLTELVVAFDKKVQVQYLRDGDGAIEVLFRPNPLDAFRPMAGAIEGVQFETANCGGVMGRFTPAAGDDVNGLRFRPINATGAFMNGDYRVLIHGEQVIGSNPIVLADREIYPALDADHIAPYLNGGQTKRCPSGNGTEGGTFRSWFHVGPVPVPPTPVEGVVNPDIRTESLERSPATRKAPAAPDVPPVKPKPSTRRGKGRRK